MHWPFHFTKVGANTYESINEYILLRYDTVATLVTNCWNSRAVLLSSANCSECIHACRILNVVSIHCM